MLNHDSLQEKSRGRNVKTSKVNFFGSTKTQYESNFECLSFDLFSLQENFMNNESDPDVKVYFLMTAVKSSLKDLLQILSQSFIQTLQA